MRIAVLADIHGNLPALEAVLVELDRDPVDRIVVAGDVVGGPLVAGCLAALRARREPMSWVKGNGEREVVAAFDGDPDAGAGARHNATVLTDADRDEIDAWPIALTLDGVCVCHGSPRDEDEILTRATPDAALRAAIGGATARLVVGGHTHQQTVRHLDPGPDYANAGSVGLPYEGGAAAFWMVVDDGVPKSRRTGYDLPAALTRLRAGGFPDLDELLDGALRPLLAPAFVTAVFEHAAGRGGEPGTPVYL